MSDVDPTQEPDPIQEIPGDNTDKHEGGGDGGTTTPVVTPEPTNPGEGTPVEE